MLIRDDQMTAFSSASVDTFVADMIAHLNRCFPAECAALGQQEVRDTVRSECRGDPAAMALRHPAKYVRMWTS